MALVSYNGFRFLCNAFLLLNAVLHPVMAFINPRMAAMCYRQALLAAVVGYAASLWISNRSKVPVRIAALRSWVLLSHCSADNGRVGPCVAPGLDSKKWSQVMRGRGLACR